MTKIATTKIWPIHDNLKRVVNYASNPEKTELNDLKQIIHYTGNPTKTSEDETLSFISGINCRAESVYEEMNDIKERFGKHSGNVAYHAYQSFKPGEVTSKQCHEIGVELARELWSKGFQVLVATHLDKDHLHNHFVINSVSMVDGRKFNCKKSTYFEMRQVSDKLCKKHSLSVIKNPKGKTPRSIYFAERNNEPTKHNLMREAIDSALKITSSQRDFKQALYDMGYTLNDDKNRKHATLCRIGDKKSVRLYRLGEEYDLPAIGKRIYQNRYAHGSNLYLYSRERGKAYAPPRKYHFIGDLQNSHKITGFFALYLHYCYLLGMVGKKEGNKPLSPQMREAVRRLDKISQRACLICREKLATTDDVAVFVESRSTEIQELTHQRQKLYNRLRRCKSPDEIHEIKRARDELTSQLIDLRRDIKIAKSIPGSVPKMKVAIYVERALQSNQREQNKLHFKKQKKGDIVIE